MKKLFYSVIASAAMACFISCAGNNNKDSKQEATTENKEKFDSTNKEADTKFAVAAADGGMMEVEASKLAATNASATNVKDFAKMMVADHGAANKELKDVAAQKNISLPVALGDDNQKKYNGLAAKKGTDFDKAYIDCMIDGHKDAIAVFQKEAEKGNDADLRTWASGKLPTIQHHYEVIQSIKAGKK